MKAGHAELMKNLEYLDPATHDTVNEVTFLLANGTEIASRDFTVFRSSVHAKMTNMDTWAMIPNHQIASITIDINTAECSRLEIIPTPSAVLAHNARARSHVERAREQTDSSAERRKSFRRTATAQNIPDAL